jgi:hypothetical protein
MLLESCKIDRFTAPLALTTKGTFMGGATGEEIIILVQGDVDMVAH